jgi:hypothetical protein
MYRVNDCGATMLNMSIEELITSIVLDKFEDGDSDFEGTYMMLLDSGEVAIAPLLASINSNNHHQHHIIASILCDILVDVHDKDALDLLLSLIDDPRNGIFTTAIRAIARFKLPMINDVLCRLLDHPAPQVRRVTAWQLGRNQAVEAISTLIDHLDEIDMETLRGMIWSLGIVGNQHVIRHIEPFTRHLKNDIAFISEEAIQRIKEKNLS